MPITQAQIYWNIEGTPVSTHYDDVYFSNVDGLAESQYVFIKQNRIPERWVTFDNKQFVIAETGFGTGLNFLATCQTFIDFRKQHPQSQLKKLHFISVEKYPLSLHDLKKSHQLWLGLSPFSNQLLSKYLAIKSGRHLFLLADGVITLELWISDVCDAFPKMKATNQGLIDCWYLDGFAPSKNPDMWSEHLFLQMARLARQNCTLATFTAASFVRRGLTDVGFDMKKIKGFGKKREMLIGQFCREV